MGYEIMTFDKNSIVEEILDETLASLQNDIQCGYEVNINQLYFMIDKYLEVPSLNSREPSVAIIQLYDDKVRDYSFTNIFLNFKNYLEDFFGFFPDVYSLFTEGNPGFVKWMILGKIVMSVCRMSYKSWGLNECLILHKLYAKKTKKRVDEDEIIDEIIHENPDISKNELHQAIDDLCRFNCLDLTDGLLKIKKRIFLRGKRND